MSDSNSFKYEGEASTDVTMDRLQKIVDSLKNGSLRFEAHGDSITLNPEDDTQLSIEAKRKDSKQTLNLEFSWKRPKPKKGGSLSISNGEEESESGAEDELKI